MPEVVYYVASSLDGAIATEDGSVDWLTPFHGGGEDYGYREFYASVDALVLGSKTYEFALGQPRWMSPDKPSWVFTRRDLRIMDPSVTLTSETPERVLEIIEDRGLRHVWLMGGGELAAAFRVRGLISSYRIFVIPVVLGGGIPLFADAPRQDRLRLEATKSYGNGVVELTYRAEGAANR